ncbi:type I toxin-antitoxin system Ibs family toxin [Citrobacter freundii]
MKYVIILAILLVISLPAY